MPKYERHALSAAFPDMPEEDFQALVIDIRDHGQIEPIILYEGKVIDGWHRYRACLEAGVEPLIETYDKELDGPDPAAWVLSKNLYRRQLPAKDRVNLAAKVLGWKPVSRGGRAMAQTVTASKVAAVAGVSRKTANEVLKAKAAPAKVEKEKAEKPAPTLEGLKKREALLVGQLESVRKQIAELEKPVQSIAKRVRRTQ